MHSSGSDRMRLQVGARTSPLSKIQVKEIFEELCFFYPHIEFDVHYMTTVGDCDQKTSLRTLDRTDFFTKEIDAWVLSGVNRVGIHSAKDLPVPLKEGLLLFCLTHGLDPSDVLVMRPNETLQSLKAGALIATSSKRRENAARMLRADFSFCDLRGTIEQRLANLASHEADGVIVAEAALIRLGMTHLNRVFLPGATAEGQGKLAVVGRKQDVEVHAIFAKLNEKKSEVERVQLKVRG